MLESDPSDVREAADRILARPEYQEPSPSLIERGFDWFNDRVQDALGSVFGEAGGYLIGYVVLGCALAIMIWLLWRVMPRRRLRRPTTAGGVEQETISRTSRREWLARAAGAEREGRFREAVMARYRAMVAGLIDDDQLPETPGTTAREHVEAFSGAADRRPPLVAATDRFELVWYGGADADAGSSATLRELDAAVLDGPGFDSPGAHTENGER